MKILGVAVAVYLALTLKIWLTWETDEVSQFDYLESESQSDEELLNFDEMEDHWTSSAFLNLCSKYKNICDNNITLVGYFVLILHFLIKGAWSLEHWSRPALP